MSSRLGRPQHESFGSKRNPSRNFQLVMGNLLHYQNDGVEELAETRKWIELEN